ncbi:MAG: hypothetical protein ACRDE8_17370 [Ginsengibacter sp.]
MKQLHKITLHKTSVFFLRLLMYSANTIVAQTTFINSHNAYLGAMPPNDTPKIFAPGLLTAKGEFSANRVAITPDGKEIYYCTNKSWKTAKDLKVKCFRYDGGKWVGPTVVNEHFGGTVFSPDYKTLYFGSDESAGSVFKSTRTKTGWSPPVEYISRNYVIYDFMPTRSGYKYAASNGTWGQPNDANAWRFSIMPAKDADTTIQSLGFPLNAPGFNGDFFIAMDESYMIVSAKETKTFACELYISFRKKDNTWTNPKTLGPLINDGVAHRYAQYVSPDGKYLFYTRGASEKDCAVYWVRFDHLLSKLRHTNFKP